MDFSDGVRLRTIRRGRIKRINKGIDRLGSSFTPQLQIWIEVSPLPPRQKEGNTFVDLVLGAISRRSPTKSGIGLDFVEKSWVCFCEMKYDSDISSKIIHDVNRNQLLRVIENGLCFQNAGKLAENIYVTLVTRKESQNKLIHKKYKKILDGYRINPHGIAEQLNNSPHGVRKQTNWQYPEDLEERIHNVKLNWVSYEELFSSMPAPPESGPNQVYQEIQHIWEYYGLSPEDWYQALLDAEKKALAGGGVLSYTPLTFKLEECAQDKGERKRIALQYLPMALSCALQNDECLHDIKNVSETYADLTPDILACAKNLRKDKLFGTWTEHESKQYKDFIVSLEATQ
jgi:hypothetical protein